MLAWAAGASNVAFLFAGVVYVCIGLAYTELAATYPVAGGGQYFVMRGLGDIFGFVAGWAVLLDFTIDVTLFAWTSVDYSSQLLPALVNSVHPWLHFTVVVLGLVAGLCMLNVIGVRESTAFNGVVSALDVISETCILCFGFLFAFRPQLLDPHDADELAVALSAHAGYVARDHLVRRASNRFRRRRKKRSARPRSSRAPPSR